MKRFLSLFILLCTTFSCTKSSPPPQTVIRIGEVQPLTGSQASFGVNAHQGIELAVKEVNDAGGIQNMKVELVTLDDQSKAEEAALATTKLISQSQVLAILGEISSSRSLAMAPIAQNSKIPMVTPGSTNGQVTQAGSYIFRTCFIDPFQGRVMANFAYDQLKISTIAILKDVKSDYSMGLSDSFISTFKAKGGEIKIIQSYSSGDIDFKSQLTSIASKKPSGIFIPGSYTEVGLIARQAKELGIETPLLGGDSWDSPKLIEIAGPAIENSYFSNHYSEENQSTVTQKFISSYKSTYGKIPDGLAALGYDGARVLLDALKRASSLSPEAIRIALSQTKDFPGVNGSISMDENRNAVKPAVVLKVKNGKFSFVNTVN